MKNEDLTGALVLVHPELENDPAKKQGQIGVLTYPREFNEMYVSFPGGGEGIYDADKLLRLKDKQAVFDDLMKNGSSMEQNDFKAMYKIMLLQDRGTSRATYDALEIARDNPGVWDKALEHIAQNEKISLQKTYAR